MPYRYSPTAMDSKFQTQIIFACVVVLCCLSTLVPSAKGDVYLHNPRGSNNRLNKDSRERRNANSLFDSQNNNRGGYNVGTEPLFYYQGSTLSIEWTNQHSCADQNANCNMVLQYMCNDQIRDGDTTSTIPTDQTRCRNDNCDTDPKYRLHENTDHYAQCYFRRRNKGLFIADQNLRGRDRAINTRQNRQGNRYGYECPEEKDYYPYWHPSPWVDIAILTNDETRCNYYRNESQNVKSRWDCVLPPSVMEQAKKEGIRLELPNNEADCLTYELPGNIDGPIRGAEWKEIPAHGVPAPDCLETQFTRDNHNGNTLGGHPVMYNWTIPSNVQSENCVMRIRYNISTSDYNPWTTTSAQNADPRRRQDGTKVEMGAKMGFCAESVAKDRGYIFEGNPTVNVFEGLDLDLRLAINTAQFGRTFQDRTHVFAIRPRPQELQGATIHNLNVRGKRGNIVQLYPAVEYDFVPNILEVNVGDYVHVQWTGSNRNPRNNDGQGRRRTDRSNIVLLAPQVYAEGSGTTDYQGAKHGHYGRNYPMRIENATFLGVSADDALKLAYVNPELLDVKGEDLSELDDADAYFNMAPIRVTSPGTYHYMCTRNNAFSNRDQKGRVVVMASPPAL